MNVEMPRQKSFFARLGMFSVAMVISTQAWALVLGEAQVQSYLGQAFKAKIPVLDISDAEAAQFKMRLARLDDYQKLDIPYPVGIHFHFQLIREAGESPYLRVSSTAPIEEPFLNLLVDVSSMGGQLVKSYTLLFDPPGDFPLAVATDEPTVDRSAVVPIFLQASDSKYKNSSLRRTRHSASRPGRAATGAVTAEPAREMGNGLHMKLAMSLSISHFDSSLPLTENVDALQEEIIAKEKALKDLHLQIDTMQGMIKTLQQRVEHTAEQGAPVSAVAAVVAEIPKPVILPKSVQVGEVKRLNYLLWLAVLTLALVTFGVYRKYKQSQAWQHGPFDELDDAPIAPIPVLVKPVHVESRLEVEVNVVKSPKTEADVATAQVPDAISPVALPLEIIEQPVMLAKISTPQLEKTQEVPAYTAQIVPPEYAMLLKANKYFRSGDDAMAEESWLAAIGLNPQNPHGYLGLLGLYNKRGDGVSFARLAQQLQATGEVAAFRDAAEMGRKLAPENPLYQLV